MQRRPTSRLVAVCVAAASLLGPRAAAANGRFPAAGQIVFAPADSSTILTRTTFGLLVSHDDGATWRWICESAIGGGSGQEDPYYGVTQTGAVVAGLWEGLSVSPDMGCDWLFAGGALGGQRIADLVVRKDDPHSVIAITDTWLSDAGSPDGALSTSYDTQVFESDDDGQHFAALGAALDPSVIAATIEVAPSDPKRIYVTGSLGTGASRTAQLFVSRDAAQTWQARPLPLLPTESAGYIGAVDPANPDVVYIRTDASSRLLVTSDGGVSYRTASFAEADGGVSDAFNGYMFGFALSPDGATIYAGGTDGLFVGSASDLRLAHVSNVQIECLAARAGEIWACSSEASGFVVGRSTDEGATFDALFHLDQLSGIAQCEADARTESCAAQYAAQCQLLDGCLGEDAGAAVPDSGATNAADSGTSGKPGSGSSHSSCGCGLAGASGSTGFFGLVLAVGAALGRRSSRNNGRIAVR